MSLISEKDQIIIAYSYDPEDKRLLGSFEYLWAKDTGLATNSTNIQPPTIEKGFIPVFDIENQKWDLVEDNRRKTVYSTKTKEPYIVEYVGEIKENFTELEPKPFETWNGEIWLDQRSDEQKENERLELFNPLTKRQFKLALLHYDLLETVEKVIESIEDIKLRTRISIEYSDSEIFERTNESVKLMLEKLDLSSDQIDEMWNYALTL
ncbi:hypothetical protein [Acinetobacter gerneri]|uniref:hypothetical protein n=1 Tax=Acinetobacter gerneri TaxID=202952 RepID=UPI003213FEDA